MAKLPIKPAVVPVPRMRTLRDEEAPAAQEKPVNVPAASKRRPRRPKFVF